MGKLFRSRKNSIIGGACGGIGEYFQIDPLIPRIITVLLVFTWGLGLLFYLIAWVLIPLRPEGEEVTAVSTSSTIKKLLPGLILIILGGIFLLHNLISWIRWGVIWPLILVVLGVAVLLKSIRITNQTSKK